MPKIPISILSIDDEESLLEVLKKMLAREGFYVHTAPDGIGQPYLAGLHRHGDMWVYVSKGTGYWGRPFDLPLAPRLRSSH